MKRKLKISDKEKLKEFINSRLTVKDMLKEDLKKAGKWYQRGTRNFESEGSPTEMVTIWINTRLFFSQYCKYLWWLKAKMITLSHGVSMYVSIMCMKITMVRGLIYSVVRFLHFMCSDKILILCRLWKVRINISSKATIKIHTYIHIQKSIIKNSIDKIKGNTDKYSNIIKDRKKK